jgi:hypothetical protein
VECDLMELFAEVRRRTAFRRSKSRGTVDISAEGTEQLPRGDAADGAPRSL